MNNTELNKSYSLDIDFLDYDKKKDVTRNIVYSEGDVNTAFIFASLKNKGSIINLENTVVTVGIKNSEGETLTNSCEVLNAQKGEIKIPFSTVALSRVGFNKFEIVIYYDENKKIVSPTFVYRVADSVSEVDGIEDSNEYDILLVLISKVQGVINEANSAIERAIEAENTLLTNEEIRRINELERIDNNLKYTQEEKIRQENEKSRETVFNQKVEKIDKLSNDIRTELDSKINEVGTQLDSMVGIFNERVSTVDSKVLEIDEKLIQVDKDVAESINSKFNEKVLEVDKKVDSILELKTDEKFKEIDLKLDEKLLENTNKTNEKISEAEQSIKNINQKIQETNQITEINTLKIDEKISEINIVKTQLENKVDSKLVEMNETKENVNTTVSSKMTELDEKFEELKRTSPNGDIINSKVSEDGVTHETLAERLAYDYSKKANKSDVYTRKEIDDKIENSTAIIEDETIKKDKVWSSNKISEEVLKSKEYTDSKISQLVGQSPELLDTLEELSTALGNDPNFATTISNNLSEKANKSEVYSKQEVDSMVSESTSINDSQVTKVSTWSSNKIQSELDNKVKKEEGKTLSTNDYTTEDKVKLQSLENYIHPDNEMTRHVSDSQINKWNNKADSNHKHSYSELNDTPNIPTKTSELINDLGFVNNSQVHSHSNKEILDTITLERVEKWDDKPIVDVNKDYVDKELQKKANIDTTYSKEEVNNLLAETTSIEDSLVTTNKTWSSQKISQHIDNAISNIPKNLAYNKLILTDEWKKSEVDNTYEHTVTHDLNSDFIFVSAIDNLSKEGVLVGYKIINKTSVLITSTEQFDCYLTIVNADEKIEYTENSGTKKNLVFEQTLNNSDWILEGSTPTSVIYHKLFTEKLFVSAIDLDTNESISIKYKILDDSKIKISSLESTHILLTIINGEREYIQLTKESEINDLTTSGGLTWSSKKISEEINNLRVQIQELNKG